MELLVPVQQIDSVRAHITVLLLQPGPELFIRQSLYVVHPKTSFVLSHVMLAFVVHLPQSLDTTLMLTQKLVKIFSITGAKVIEINFLHKPQYY
jgi:hypothetical protein